LLGNGPSPIIADRHYPTKIRNILSDSPELLRKAPRRVRTIPALKPSKHILQCELQNPRIERRAELPELGTRQGGIGVSGPEAVRNIECLGSKVRVLSAGVREFS
jgi:hypothetical protein